MPIAPQTLTATIASGDTTSNIIDLRGNKITSVYVPTMDSATLTIQCSYDGTTTTCKAMEDTAGNTIGQWTAQTYDCYLDGDTLARFMGVNYIRFVAGAAQNSGAVAIKVVLAQE